MHEGFVISNQHKLYFLFEEKNGIIEALSFDFKIYKFGYPNDEVGLPSRIPRVEPYCLMEVFNSNWIKELKKNNRSHHRHSDSHYAHYKHYILRLKDVTLEVISGHYKIVQLTKSEIDHFFHREIGFLATQDHQR